MAWLFACRLVDFAMLPMLRYTGQACLSPLNRERFVLSEERMIGVIVAPSGNLPCNAFK